MSAPSTREIVAYLGGISLGLALELGDHLLRVLGS
jgi:hypothetical protein